MPLNTRLKDRVAGNSHTTAAVRACYSCLYIHVHVHDNIIHVHGNIIHVHVPKELLQCVCMYGGWGQQSNYWIFHRLLPVKLYDADCVCIHVHYYVLVYGM